MKHLYKILFSALLATFFVVAGSGYNIVHYCCDECAKHGIVEVATHSCEEFHHPVKTDCTETNHIKNNEHRDMACTDIIHMNDGCHLLRLHTDVPSLHTQSIYLGADYQKILAHDTFTFILFQTTEPEKSNVTYPPPILQDNPGRKILNKTSVLLI